MELKNVNLLALDEKGQPVLVPFSSLKADVSPQPDIPVDPVPANPTPVDSTTIDPTPATPKLAGDPRTLVGHKGTSAVYECTINGSKGLIQVTGENPDCFLGRGYNFDYEPIGVKPTGPESANYGNDPLFDGRPEGYRKRYYSDKRLFWEQSADADEPYPVDIPVPPSEPVQVVVDHIPAAELSDDQMIVWNPETFSPIVQWKDGLARILNAVNLVPGPGENLYVSVGGQPPTVGFPLEYRFKPGQQVTILVFISSAPDQVRLDPNKKGYAKIRLGQPQQTS